MNKVLRGRSVMPSNQNVWKLHPFTQSPSKVSCDLKNQRSLDAADHSRIGAKWLEDSIEERLRRRYTPRRD
jgi:hypothetical protein